MNIDLSGKVAIVTGSSHGIGRGIAAQMGRSGANVTVNCRSHLTDAEEVATEIRDAGSDALVCQGDASDRAVIDQMVETTVEEFGRLDIVVSNAYYSKRQPFLELDLEGARRTIDVTFWSAFHLAQAGAQQMAKQGDGGAILFISSVLAELPMSTSLTYCAAKAGINQMSAVIAKELASQNIRSNAINPGWIDTPGERQFMTEEDIQREGQKLPLGRLGTAEDIGKTAAFLCSDAASYITGAVVQVDGGYWFKVELL